MSSENFETLLVEVKEKEYRELSDSISYEAPHTLYSYISNPPNTQPLSGFELDFNLDTAGEEEDEQCLPNSVDRGDSRHSWTKPDSESTWPQRLLHVPTMTSVEWAPGDIYASRIKPRYNAISYTWGRFDLQFDKSRKAKRLRNIRPIEIHGTTWVDVMPRIDPNHFSVSEIMQVIQHSQEASSEDGVEFVWLDVACIDQRDGPQKSFEIGRQAGIFKGANRVYVWLTKIHVVKLNSLLQTLAASADYAVRMKKQKDVRSVRSQSMDDQIAWLSASRSALDELFLDPWFSSLWTLQEAFLCPNAYLLPREASAQPATLLDLWRWCDILQTCCLDPREVGYNFWEYPTWEYLYLNEKYTRDIEGMIRERSISALASKNPMALYGAANYRKTRNEMDRVYAIQQVFDLRLGASAPGSEHRKHHPIKLENQLGAAILETYPIPSQLHIFAEPVELGRGWRISKSSRIPDLGLKSNTALIKYIPDCRLTSEARGGKQWGSFSGRICLFEVMSKAWLTLRPPPEDQAKLYSSPQSIMLDVFLSTKDFGNRNKASKNWPPESFGFHQNPAIWNSGAYRDIPRNTEQHELAEWMVQRLGQLFKGKRLVILSLGHIEDTIVDDVSEEASLGPRHHVGLILVESELSGISYWRRLGFCLWECEEPPSTSNTSENEAHRLLCVPLQHEQWKTETGLFG